LGVGLTTLPCKK